MKRVLPSNFRQGVSVALIVISGVAALAVFLLIVSLFWSPPVLPPEALKDTPPWVSQFLIPILLKRIRWILVVFGLLGLAFTSFVFVLALKFNRADKVSFWGIEFQVPDEITRLQRELEAQIEHNISLQENTRELQDLIEEQSPLLLNPDVLKYFDFLDKIVETAAFVIRPSARSVRASVWLYDQAQDEMRIIAGYRISHSTRRNLVLKLNGSGFAPFVLRSRAPQVQTPPTLGNTWVHDPDSVSATTSILGQPIKVGGKDDWQAILCFSTDRDLAKFPQYAFSIHHDAPTLRLFAAIVSFTLTLSRSIKDTHTNTLLIERLFQRYR